jgi:DNA-binding NtrC family response regulator
MAKREQREERHMKGQDARGTRAGRMKKRWTPSEETGLHARASSLARAEMPPPVVRAIRIVRPDGEANVLRLDGERPQILIGRGDAVDVRIESDRVSRLHGLLRFQDDQWWYEDMGSTNGSFIVRAEDVASLQDVESTQEIAARVLSPKERQRLRVGDVVILGSRHATLEPLSEFSIENATSDDDTRRSTAAQAFARDVLRASTTHLPVFLLGPSGAGKTTAARDIHDRSGTRGRFVPINCARLPRDDGHLHSTLLGHVKGGFTGAIGAREGLFVHAVGGTLFLDEVESLPDIAQGFLLDVLESTGMLLPFGATPADAPLALRFRLISASKKALHATTLRPDLAQRLTEGHIIEVPSLAQRKADIPGIARVILEELGVEQNAQFTLSRDALRFLVDATWDGEIRALRSIVRTAAMNARVADETRATRPRIALGQHAIAEVYEARVRAFGVHTSTRPASPADERLTLRPDDAVAKNPRHLTEDDVRRALDLVHGNVTHAARALGVARNTLVTKMKAFGLRER